jgi:hypothetical protein
MKGGRSGNASSRAIPDPFFDAESKNDACFGPQTSTSNPRPLLWAKKEVFLPFFAVFIAGPGETLGSPWPPLAVRLCPEHLLLCDTGETEGKDRK